MLNIFKKPDQTQAQQLTVQKRAMEKALRQQGLSRKQAATVVSKTFSEIQK